VAVIRGEEPGKRERGEPARGPAASGHAIASGPAAASGHPAASGDPGMFEQLLSSGYAVPPEPRPSTWFAGEQGTLFDAVQAPVEDAGYRQQIACAAAGITYRQLDYWARTGLVEPSIRKASGSGTQRLYGFRDILVLRVVKRLLDLGISLQQVRSAVAYLRENVTANIAQVTLMSDGASVYACTSDHEVVDLLHGGQGVFGIVLGQVWQEVEGSLAKLPAEGDESTDDSDGPDMPGSVASPGAVGGDQDTGADELARRRAWKTG
jgi:DNA-binding transcriptional MerR regulator